MSAVDNEDEDSPSIAYTSPEITDAYAKVDVCTAESVKETHK